mmetsp:Transcript_10821/g.22712  ORF Transcript_10821/g.22712 Transcript_10821/m.22712 type:complete len:392 (-) Transcript_10821:211-1386(-)
MRRSLALMGATLLCATNTNGLIPSQPFLAQNTAARPSVALPGGIRRRGVAMSMTETEMKEKRVPLSVVNKGVRIQTTREVVTEKYTPSDPSKASAVLADAYEQCKKITAVFAKTFYLGTKLMTEEQKTAVWAIYVWCRRTDDLVDGPRAMMSPETMRADLAAWEERLYEVWDGRPEDSLDLALLDTKRRYPDMELEPFLDMIQGMIMDTPQLGQDRYQTWDELYLYCYRVASTVGLMCLPVMGTAKGYTFEQAKEPAIALGIALQITNILRDVGEDAVRGRIYLPLEDLERFGVTEQNLINGVMDENYKNLIKFEIQRARDYYALSQEGIPMLAPEARLSVQAAGDMYGEILNKIEANDYDNFRKRAFVSKFEKFSVLPKSWATVSAMPKE